MNILVFNCGSSSLNYKVFQFENANEYSILIHGKAHRVGVKGTEASFIEHHLNGKTESRTLPISNHQEAAGLVIQYLNNHHIHLDAVGHRFVHGGIHFNKSALLTTETYKNLQSCLPLASIHNPNSMSVIDECLSVFQSLPQYITFDTAFHASLPDWAYSYALPGELAQKYNLRKFGFHGLSYQYVTQEASRFLGKPLESLKIIACHLGTGGSSVAAIKNGKSVDTSMGFSPLAGLIMSTRSGDLDPMIPLHLITEHGFTSAELNDLFNKKSGLLGISGFSSDIRDILHRLEETQDHQARLAFQMYTYRLKQYIGSYIAVLGGLDVLIFTDDIGIQSWQVREETCREMTHLGINLDAEVNRGARFDEICILSKPEADVCVLSMPTNEELIIGLEGFKLLQSDSPFS